MTFIQQPAYIICVILLLIVFSEWLAQKKFFKHLGSVLIIIIGAAILSNLKIIPSSHNASPLYSKIFEYAAPLGIFFLLIDIRIKDLKLAGFPMLMMFFLGSAATVAAVIISYKIVSPQNHHVSQAYAVAGMFTGTYSGGSANLSAVALAYGVNKNGNLFAAINAVDNIVSTVWIFITIFIPPILQKQFPRKKIIPPEIKGTIDVDSFVSLEKPEISITDIALLLAIGFGSLFISLMVSTYFPIVPSILVLTTLAILLGQIPFVQKLHGSKILGFLMIMFFLAVIGAFCDIRALLQNTELASTLLIWDTILILIHGTIIFTLGGILKQDWDVISIASNANVGGATTAPVCAISLGRSELQLPGILVGSIGYALGTYLGILIAELLR